MPASPEIKPLPVEDSIEEVLQPNKSGVRKNIGILTSGGDAQGMNPSIFIYEGYQGLVDGGDRIREAQWSDVSGFLKLGGTSIGTARCKAFRELEGRRTGVLNLIRNGIDALIVIGGDGSLTGADRLRAEWPEHVSALESEGKISGEEAERFRTLMIVGMVGSIDNDLSSTDMTIGAGSALARICESVDAILSTAMSHQRAFVAPPKGDDWEMSMCATLKASRDAGKRTSLVIVAEGAIDRNLKPIKSEYIRDILRPAWRGGAPVHFDRFLGTMQGAEAVEAILRATPETPSPVIGMLENKITTQPLKEAIELTGQVAQAIEAKDFDRAMHLRAAAFSKQLRTAVRLCLNRGHTPIGVHNGFPGLMRGEIEELDWMSVDGWTIAGGSRLGTTETSRARKWMQKHLLLPATLSNNVPGTDFSLGSDTAANVIVQATDMIKQSASSNRRRVFVIEVQGGNCGFLAVMAGLSGGSTTVYTPEEGIDLSRLQRDIAHLRSRYVAELARSEGRVTLCNERASSVYNTEMIGRIYEAESGGFFGARTAVLGHLQQGGTPSSLDRCRANTMAADAVNWLQTSSPSSVAVIGVIGSEMRFTPITELVAHTDFERRVPRTFWWKASRQLIDILSGVGVDIVNGGCTTPYKSCAIDLTADDLMRIYGQHRRLSKLTDSEDQDQLLRESTPASKF
ncbi:phosphofructokinase domain-containing protein [Kickxella alabastrina]|uniref:phosphofructokinase domain-containing protein n=1 Tax=Kickxella alabastrina TaxID=61397 RepID=UPI002220177C|nr:phosphofructokinase domain-containing protein [Kickxella alabastrina]KAI7827302.1 phosphofructokinase domain-containing protein [Kickxella alabastrina]